MLIEVYFKYDSNSDDISLGWFHVDDIRYVGVTRDKTRATILNHGDEHTPWLDVEIAMPAADFAAYVNKAKRG